MSNFDELVTARKEWINNVLKPWCQGARRSELLKADVEWLDIAGKVTAEKTLWLWAWSRFPELVHENLGIEETSQIELGLQDGRQFCGFPDSRQSVNGQLVLLGTDRADGRLVELGPFSIDEIAYVNRLPD
ncbi:hypothetical protein [Schlesneria paludicola]|uniref:hypothetical protein n=1 Tax=Schlesneria paludicola TaxID=360056 RepID=UPI00029AB87D|nr:hypothetical protein [Schlesneria paludicola]